jgi:hypothetical protein
LFSSYDVIDSFFKWKSPTFFLDSDSPFNCLNGSVKILLSYIRKFLRKKIINLEKINFITNKNKSKEKHNVGLLRFDEDHICYRFAQVRIFGGKSNVLSVDIKTWDKRHNCIKSKIRNIHWVNLAFYKQGYKNYDILSETPS